MIENNAIKKKEHQITLNDRGGSIFGVDRVDPMFSGGKRDWSVDVLRCLSCFMVCAIHATDKTTFYDITDQGANAFLHHEIYRMALASPTVLFVMVSGIFFLSPERNVKAAKVWKKNVFKMAFAYIFWCLAYALYRIHVMDPQPELTMDLIFREWLIQQGHLWYIPMIIGLYIVSPILRPITATYDGKLFAYIIAVFMGGLILWTIYNWPTVPEDGSNVTAIIDKTPKALLCHYPFWMLYGWIAYTYRPRVGLRYIIYAVGIAATIVGILVNIHYYNTLGDTEMTAMTQKFGILQFFKNTALFYFIVTVFRDHEFSATGKIILRKLSDCTLIIYLVHEMILLIMYDNDFLYPGGTSPWIGVWVYAVISYVGGGLFAIGFHALWDPVKKALFTKEKRSEKIYKKMEKKEITGKGKSNGK